MTNNPLDYNYIAPGEESHPKHSKSTFRIQASSIAGFIDYTSSWYGEKLLNQGGFEGNIASYAGTVLHYMAERLSLNGSVSQPDRDNIYAYLEEANATNPMIVADEVLERVRPMWQALKQHLLANPSSLNEPYVEFQTNHQGIVAGGSIDSIIDLTDPDAKYTSLDELPRDHQYKLVDYKSTSAKTPPKSFSRGYHWQLLTYALALKELGINVVTIELVFILSEHIGEISPKTGRQMKSYPAQVHQLAKSVTSEDLLFIEGLIQLISDSVYRFITVPQDRFLLAQDGRLRLDTTPIHYADMTSRDEDI